MDLQGLKEKTIHKYSAAFGGPKHNWADEKHRIHLVLTTLNQRLYYCQWACKNQKILKCEILTLN